MSELQALQKQLEAQLKSNPAKEIAIADAPGTGKSRAAIIGGGKFSEELPRAKAMADEIRKINRGSIATSAPMEQEIKRLASEPVDLKGKIGNYIEEDIRRKLATSAPMETPYGKSFLSYTPEGKIAGKAGSVLRGLGRVAGPLGAALTALDFAQAAGEIREKGAAKIAEDYKKSKMAESEAQILTPEVDEFREGLKSRRTELEILRAELKRKRQKEERDREREQRGIERQARVRDTLEKTGLLP